MNKSNMMLIVAAALLAVGCAARACFGAGVAPSTQELYPYALVGRIVNGDNIAYDGTSGIRLFVTDKDGVRLAQTAVFTPGSLGAMNFTLMIPVATSRVPGYATIGDTVQLTARVGDSTYTGLLDAGDAKIGSPGAAVNLRLMLAEDENGNGVADVYEESVLDRAWELGIDIDETYDPNGDYDGDGKSNLEEYRLGTDALDAKDCFTVRAADVTDDLFALTVDMNAGRTYSVKDSDDLKTWNRAAFRLSPESGDEVNFISNDSHTWTTTTVYLLKKGARRFYKAELEE